MIDRPKVFKKRLSGLFALCLGMVLTTIVSARVIDRIAAVVNDSVVLLSEVDTVCQSAINEVSPSLPLDQQVNQRRKIRLEALDALIDELLLSQKVAEHKIKVKDEEVKKNIQQLKRDNNMDDKQFAEALAMEGRTVADLKSNIRKQLEQSKLIDVEIRGNPEMRSKIQISEKDIEESFRSTYMSAASTEKIKASHILFSVPTDAEPQAEENALAKANAVLNKLKNGADFAKLAKKHSDDPSSALGGDLGWFKRGDMLAPFEKAAFGLKKGQFSGAVRTRLGVHVIMVTGRGVEGVPELDNVRAEIRNRLYREKFQRAMKEWLAELRQKSFVEIKL